MRKKFIPLLLAGIVSAPVCAAVSDPSLRSESTLTSTAEAQPEAAEYSAPDMIVTGNRHNSLRDALPQRVDVISNEEMERTSARDFGDVLKKHSSVDIIQYPGALDAVGIRGFAPAPYSSAWGGSTLVLIDGHPAGTANLATLNTANVDHVELLKGPGSALYGSQAMGGVLNLITKKSTGPVKGQTWGTVGSADYWQVGAALGGSAGSKVDFDLNAMNESQLDDFTLPNGAKQTNSTYSTNRAGLRLGANLPGGWRADLSGDGYFGNHIAYTGSDQNTWVAVPSYKDLDRFGGDLTFEGPLFGSTPSLVFFASRLLETDYDSLPASTGTFYHSFCSDVLWQGVQFKDLVELGPHSIVWGVDYKKGVSASECWSEPVTAPNYTDMNRVQPYNPDSTQQTVGYYAQGSLNFFEDRVAVNVGGREDVVHLWLDSTPYGPDFTPGDKSFSSFSPSAGLRLSPWKWLNVHSSYGHAFVSPDANQLAGSTVSTVYDATYTPHAAVFSSNANLRPQSSDSLDAGLGVVAPAFGTRTDLTWFKTNVVDKIQQQNAGGYNFTYVNLSGTTEIVGMEGELSQDFGTLLSWGRQVKVFGNFTQIFRAKQALATDNKDIDILNIADQKVQVGAEYDDRRLFARLAGRYRGTVLDSYMVYEYPPVWVWDFSAGFKITESTRCDLLVDNLTNVDYYEKAGYPMPGTNYKMKLSYLF